MISPLLSNIYLHWLDKVFHRPDGPGQWAKARLVRYADDFVVMTRYRMQDVSRFIETKLEQWMGLQLNREKTRIVHFGIAGAHLDFLGYTFRYDRDLHGRRIRYLNVVPSEKAMIKARAKLRELTSSRYCYKPVTDVIAGVNRTLEGWAAYFCFGYPRQAYRDLDYYVQHRMRLHLNRRSQRRYQAPEGVSLYSHLRTLGLQRLSSRFSGRLFT